MVLIEQKEGLKLKGEQIYFSSWMTFIVCTDLPLYFQIKKLREFVALSRSKVYDLLDHDINKRQFELFGFKSHKTLFGGIV